MQMAGMTLGWEDAYLIRALCAELVSVQTHTHSGGGHFTGG